jgi:DNA polymerase bacteriophage-type
MIPQPPKLENLPAGTKLVAGMGTSTVLADFDFETYSEAGYLWNPQRNKFDAPPNAIKKGLPSIGAAVYSEHASTEVLSCAYDLKDGKGKRLWRPGELPPIDLFQHLIRGGLLEAWNIGFERWIWLNVCERKYGWPPLPFDQLRCAKAKSHAFAIPGGLDAAGNIMNIEHKKHKDGKRLLEKFSMPRNPTRHDVRTRIRPQDDLNDANLLYQYNLQDIAAESELSSLFPDLTEHELDFWLCDQKINFRGVQLDQNAIINGISIIEQAYKKYNNDLLTLTKGKVSAASEIQKLRNWMMEYGVHVPNLDAEDVSKLLAIDSLPDDVRKALKIREMVGLASVKKLYSMLNQSTQSGRVHDLFVYHSARTGRAAGAGPQPQNLPNSGPEVCECQQCKKHYGINAVGNICPWCGYSLANKVEWNPVAVQDAFETLYTGNLECVEYYWGNAIEIISACLRGMFIAATGKDLICSDYSAIEAVVLAALSGETWRMDVFNTHGKIYEMSASKITGIPFDEFIRHKKETGQHHPMRKKVGKVAELASGYQGWIGAWKQFGADEFFNDDEMKRAILAWRAASPKIVEMWGGQIRDWYPCFYGLEGAAVQAVLSPGKRFDYRGISYIVNRDVLYCQILSGRYLTYHKPRVVPSVRKADTVSLSFEGWNTNPKYGSIGWVRMETYGGKLTENVVQATARDILAHAIVNLEKAGYPVVLHVHDEIVAEIPENWGSVAEFEEIMSKLPVWASDWPVKANGGWRGKRYAK